MGDTVNLTSRLEGLTKQYGVDIIVNHGTVQQVPDYTFRELDLVRVKGKQRPVAIYEPVAATTELSADKIAILTNHETALAAFRRGDWNKAIQLFEKLAEPTGELLYNVYLERIQEFRRTPPPPDWDGVF